MTMVMIMLEIMIVVMVVDNCWPGQNRYGIIPVFDDDGDNDDGDDNDDDDYYDEDGDDDDEDNWSMIFAAWYCIFIIWCWKANHWELLLMRVKKLTMMGMMLEILS